jgi:hypothetical protein
MSDGIEFPDRVSRIIDEFLGDESDFVNKFEEMF